MGSGRFGFKTHSEYELDRLAPVIDAIEELAPVMAQKTDLELRAMTGVFKKRLQRGETLEDILVEAFAVCREATKRVMNTFHYTVQVIGGIIIHQGRIAQMRTGEGKTQTCILPAYLNALEGKGVHVITVNDYLAERDAEITRQVHNFLGLSVGVVVAGMSKEDRKKAYNCDITYVTNSELVFDYLLDNMAIYKEKQVLRELHYCIIDEIDSILVDSARTPLRISGKSQTSLQLYEDCDKLVRTLERGEDIEELSQLDYLMGSIPEETGDYLVNEKDKIINLTSRGMDKVEKFFGIENYADPENLDIQQTVMLCLRAHELLEKDVDYVVVDGEVLLIDAFTGRIMYGTKLSNGLHQAVEAKEGLEINEIKTTVANITYQCFFNNYKKKGGMSGTVQTQEQEFRDVYYMDVVIVPPHKDPQRIDYPDVVYRTYDAKVKAIIEETRKAHEKEQPVIIGTNTIEQSEKISKALLDAGIEHNVLNAKKHREEAAIVAESGKHGAVTIATNMAGRGTDIKLDAEARAAGGLRIIGSEKADSKRIDDQLRGRSGRQGDVGETQFILSLEDDLLINHASPSMLETFKALKSDDDKPLKHRSLISAIDAAQENIEATNYASRLNLLKYDKILDEQREIVYEERQKVLDNENMHPTICRMIENVANYYVNYVIGSEISYDKWPLAELNEVLLPIIPIKPITRTRLDDPTRNGLKVLIKREALALYEQRMYEYGQVTNFTEVERVVLLKVIDKMWSCHIEDIGNLRNKLNFSKYEQKDPFLDYQLTSYAMFDEMIQEIKEETVRLLFGVKMGKDVKREEMAQILEKSEML